MTLSLKDTNRCDEVDTDGSQKKDLLRFITCGSVDDGKSTLIGRLLLDAGAIYDDQISALQVDSERHGTNGTDIDTALLLDGLEDERHQGITIDVAYRYFTTGPPKVHHRGHARSRAVHAEHGNRCVDGRSCNHFGGRNERRADANEASTRSLFSLLGIKHVILAVNKMDLVDFEQEVFEKICADFGGFAQKLNIPDIRFVSAFCAWRRQCSPAE